MMVRTSHCRRGNLVRAHQAFSLIEMLIVVAVIGILTAILFPVISKAREKAKQSSCASNLRQLGMAFIQYTQDYDEQFPCGIEATNGTGYGWGAQLYPYVKAKGIFICPIDGEGPLPQDASLPVPPLTEVKVAEPLQLVQEIFVVEEAASERAGEAAIEVLLVAVQLLPSLTVTK